MSLHRTKPEHEVAYQDPCALVNKHADKLTAAELLAVAGNMVGKLIALQDQRKMRPAEALEIVARNIEQGNLQVLQQIQHSKGSA